MKQKGKESNVKSESMPTKAYFESSRPLVATAIANVIIAISTLAIAALTFFSDRSNAEYYETLLERNDAALQETRRLVSTLGVMSEVVVDEASEKPGLLKVVIGTAEYSVVSAGSNRVKSVDLSVSDRSKFFVTHKAKRPAKYRTEVRFEAQGESFTCSEVEVGAPGKTSIVAFSREEEKVLVVDHAECAGRQGRRVRGSRNAEVSIYFFSQE